MGKYMTPAEKRRLKEQHTCSTVPSDSGATLMSADSSVHLFVQTSQPLDQPQNSDSAVKGFHVPAHFPEAPAATDSREELTNRLREAEHALKVESERTAHAQRNVADLHAALMWEYDSRKESDFQHQYYRDMHVMAEDRIKQLESQLNRSSESMHAWRFGERVSNETTSMTEQEKALHRCIADLEVDLKDAMGAHTKGQAALGKREKLLDERQRHIEDVKEHSEKLWKQVKADQQETEAALQQCQAERDDAKHKLEHGLALLGSAHLQRAMSAQSAAAAHVSRESYECNARLVAKIDELGAHKAEHQQALAQMTIKAVAAMERGDQLEQRNDILQTRLSEVTAALAVKARSKKVKKAGLLACWRPQASSHDICTPSGLDCTEYYHIPSSKMQDLSVQKFEVAVDGAEEYINICSADGRTEAMPMARCQVQQARPAPPPALAQAKHKSHRHSQLPGNSKRNGRGEVLSRSLLPRYFTKYGEQSDMSAQGNPLYQIAA